VRQASIYARRMISEISKYDGQFVGDGVDVFTIEVRPETWPRPGFGSGPSDAWDEEINLMTCWMEILFRQITDKDTPLNLDQFIKAVKRFRKFSTGSSNFTLSDLQKSEDQQ
jgi:hypothetical protein